ncbi:hypothetical protein HYW94_03055 [Candidatus Uhrbacteria bacterium]|nr:hypothetical protein [Candidatus Uhrbacteria bacterium]
MRSLDELQLPNISSQSVTAAVTLEHAQMIWVGTSFCCWGYLMQFREKTLHNVFALPINVDAIIPVVIDRERGAVRFGDCNDPNRPDLLVVGSGCNGAGVWLQNNYSPRGMWILGGIDDDGEEFRKTHQEWNYFFDNVFEWEDERLYVVSYTIYPKPGQNGRFVTSSRAYGRTDITDLLLERGLDIEMSMKLEWSDWRIGDNDPRV